MTQQMMSSMAPVHASPFAALADCNGAFMPAAADADAAAALVQLCQQQPMAQQQRAATCGYPNACNGTPAAVRGSLPLHMDLDALLAAASCKPGYNSACMPVSCKPASVPASLQAAEAAAAHRASAVSAVLQQYGALQVASGSAAGIADAALGVIGGSGVCDTFYVYDLGEVARLHATWLDTMPRVAPFYAVKCNPEPGMVAMLNALGAGFDCASVQELKCAAAHNVPQDRVIFANPCKRPADFRYARENGVEYTTFDCVCELEKIAAGYPAFKCVLRIRCDDADAKINLGLKYGADLSDVPMLLGMARHLGLQVVGVSFHVGSGCQNVGVYADAIAAAREAFDMAASYGFNMELLDIGGGFTAPYDEPSARLFYQTAGVINGALAACFPEGCGVRIIAEPGRYFAETSATLFTTILGQRASCGADGQGFRDYWLSDGTYGSFRIQVAVDGLEPSYSVLRSPLLPPPTAEEDCSLLACRLWGNSDRDGDVVHKAALLPALRDGDWLMFPYAGAYTICAASNYGGVCFTQPLKVFVYSSEALRDLGGFDLLLAWAAAAAACLMTPAAAVMTA